MHLIFCCRRCYFLVQSCPEMSREAKTGVQQKNRKKYVFKKGCLPTFSGPQKLANIILFIYFWYKTCVFCIQKDVCQLWLNFSQKLANVPPGQDVGKHTPPPKKKSGGLIYINIQNIQRIKDIDYGILIHNKINTLKFRFTNVPNLCFSKHILVLLVRFVL